MFKAKELVSTQGLSEADWLAWRAKGIGGSDVAAICGLSPFKSPVQVYLEKVGAGLDQEESRFMRWGKLLEPVIADEFARETGHTIQPVHAILQHTDHDWALANVDRGIHHPSGQHGVLEVKNTSAWMLKEWEEERVPEHYLLQLQWYLWVTGCDWGYFAALIGGNQLVKTEAKLDMEIIEPLIKICSEFWSMVENRTPPAPDGSNASSALLKTLYPNAKAGTIVALPGELEPEIVKLEELKEELKEFKKAKEYEIDAIENKIKDVLKDSEAGSINGRLAITWKETQRAGYTVAPTSYRTLRIVKPKTKEKK